MPPIDTAEGPGGEGLEPGEVAQFFGGAYSSVADFARLLGDNAGLRGLMGPGEVARLWSRHLVNSGALAGHLPTSGLVIDVGSGAGLPGIVLALMRPDLRFELVDSMKRRTDWLGEVVGELRLENVTVTRSRAEQLAGRRSAQAVVSRAVARLDVLAGWTAPLLAKGGEFLALKGATAHAELADTRAELNRHGLVRADVVELAPVGGVEATFVVRAQKAS
jgi:16S rRNA (guanine527-N7)-methyltransferase